MPDKQIEKSLLYLILLSTLLHTAAFGVLRLLPSEHLPAEKVTMVDLAELPLPPLPERPKPLPPPEPAPPKAKPLPRSPRFNPLARVPKLPPERLLPQAAREAAPEGERETERIVQSAPNLPGKTNRAEEAARSPGNPASALTAPEKGGKDAVRGEGLFKPQHGDRTDLARLFPSARSMDKAEEGYRKKYVDAERGDTRLMDTNDPLIGVFTRRYVLALNDRLNALDRHERKGLGTTILRITVTRDGSIGDIRILYSTGNEALDALAIKASRTVGYVGPLPSKWPHDVYNMICSFTIIDDNIAARWSLH